MQPTICSRVTTQAIVIFSIQFVDISTDNCLLYRPLNKLYLIWLSFPWSRPGDLMVWQQWKLWASLDCVTATLYVCVARCVYTPAFTKQFIQDFLQYVFQCSFSQNILISLQNMLQQLLTALYTKEVSSMAQLHPTVVPCRRKTCTKGFLSIGQEHG